MLEKNSGKYSLEELLSLSNYQILKKWAILASLIRHNEYNESNTKDWSKGWHPSREKAIYLISTEKAEEYINKVRAQSDYGKEQEAQNPIKVDVVEQVKSEPDIKPVKSKKKGSIYRKNYELLTGLLPEFESRLINGESLWAVSDAKGYEGIVLLAPLMAERHHAVYEVYHFVEDGDRYRTLTLQTIEVNIATMRVEPIYFQDKDVSKSVEYPAKGQSNMLVDIEERKRQNRLFKDFLNNLIHNRHKFVWDEQDDQGLIQKLRRQKKCFDYDYSVKNSVDENNHAIINLQYLIEEMKLSQTRLHDELGEERARRVNAENKNQELKNRDTNYNSLKLTFNSHIPEFQLGEVEFLVIYKLIGITSEDIDQINEKRKTLNFFPRPDGNISGFELLANGKVRFAR